MFSFELYVYDLHINGMDKINFVIFVQGYVA